jgi:hypothetical protein
MRMTATTRELSLKAASRLPGDNIEVWSGLLSGPRAFEPYLVSYALTDE